MRDIKFRAWNRFLGYWITHEEMLFKGDGLVLTAPTYTIPMGDDWELMQFTGLKDKNGEEIYEGDIIRAKRCQDFFEREQVITWEVKFDAEQAYGLAPESVGGPDGNIWYEDIEVIGNIYENPELLK